MSALGRGGIGIKLYFLLSLVLFGMMAVVEPPGVGMSMVGYLPLHSVMEIFSVTVSVLIFAVAWSTYTREQPASLVVLACAMLAVGIIDTAHLLSYPGMPDFVTPASAQKSIFFWLCARGILAAALLYRALRPATNKPKPARRHLFLVAALALSGGCLWIGLTGLDRIPQLYIPGRGLTTSKIVTEIVIAIAYAVAGSIFILRAYRGRSRWMLEMACACWTMVISESYFTLFIGHSDALNILGHVYKVIAYGFLYRAVFLQSVRQPIKLLRASESALRLSEKALHTTQIAIDRSHEYIFMFDAEGRFSYVNARAIQRLGYSREELLAMKVADIDVNYRGDAWRNHWRELLGCGSLVLETEHLSKLGEPYPVEVVVTLIRENDEVFACAIGRDISERLKAEQKIRESLVNEARARAEARAKGEFLARMSHEIRTPMNGVLGMSELLLDSGLTEVQKSFCRVMNSSAAALLGVINDILDISKIEAGQLAIEKLAFSLPEVVDDIVSLFQLKASEKGLLLLSHIKDDVPAWVLGDPTRIRQILINFVGNAIKFTDEGSVTITVRVAGADSLRFEVQDTGRGIAPENQARLFSPFTQANASIARTHGGTGLGLAISKELAQLMEGSVGLSSEAGKGSCFWLELALPSTTSTDTRAEKPLILPSGRPLTLLVVDDNPTNQVVIQAMLRKLGHDSLLASNGEEAMAIFQTRYSQLDAILMDCEMPGMDGFEATRKIRAMEKDRGIAPHCVIAVTANALDEYRERSIQAGMDGYLVKPITITGLAQSLAKVNDSAGRSE